MNMWCAQTLMLTNAMHTVAATITGYPKIGLREKTGNDFRHESKTRNDQNVDFRMSKDPKEVHPEDCRSASLGIEEMAAQVSIDEQHDLSGR